MIATATLKTIFLALFGLTIIWIIKIVVKREFETLFRAILVSVFFGVILLYLNQTKLEMISWKAVRHEIFPEKAETLTYVKNEGFQDGIKYIRYFFPAPTSDGSDAGPSPRLNLSLDKNGRHYHITDIEPVNKVLTMLGLPPVKAGAMELASITGRSTDVNQYRWDDYPLGVLILERGLCQNKDSLERYHCVVFISVQGRG
jgi:hypothetical protein